MSFMAARTSHPHLWRGSTRSSAVVLAIVLIQGCQPGARAPRTGYANLDRLVRLHPAIPALRELEEQIGVSAPEPAAPQPPDLTPPEGPPAPKPSKPLEPASQEAGAERLRREMAEATERRISLKKKDLDRASRAALAEEETRAASQLLDERRKIMETRRARILNLESNIGLLSQRLQSESLALGERRQTEDRIAALERELDSLQAEEKKELAAAASRHRQRMDAFRKERSAEDEAELSMARAALEEEFKRAVERHAARVRRTFAPPPMPALPAGSRRPAEVLPAPRPASRVSTRHKEMLRAQYSRLRDSIRRETAQTARSLAASHNIDLVLDPHRKRSAPDVTAKVSSWLKRYWSVHPAAKEASQP